MITEFDIIGIIRACNFYDCVILVSKDGTEYDEVVEEEYNRLRALNGNVFRHIKKQYKGVIWSFTDCTDEVDDGFEVQYYLPDDGQDGVHFRYGSLSFKTKYTLINILKSQKAWKSYGLAFYDNETEDIIDDSFYTEGAVACDMWLNEFDAMCRKYVIDSQHASLFKGEEEVNNGSVEILDLIIDTNSSINGHSDK